VSDLIFDFDPEPLSVISASEEFEERTRPPQKVGQWGIRR
jgi:hypothetical protein